MTTASPLVLLSFEGQSQAMIVDTGFNGDLELPEIYGSLLNPRSSGRVRSVLAGGQWIEEELFAVTFPFDGHEIEAEVTFTPEVLGLIGTNFLRDYRLAVDFHARTLMLERVVDHPQEFLSC